MQGSLVRRVPYNREATLRGNNISNLKKTIYYLKRNGFGKTWYAVRERLDERSRPPYHWMPPSEEELERQRRTWEQKEPPVTFSIVVPAYRTKEAYLRELMKSVCGQTYPKWELILADASGDDSVKRVVGTVEDPRIRYVCLKKNEGIAGNTNQALPLATGEYIGLLDHDDILTLDALHEMAGRIEEGRQRGIAYEILYTDEDKCNGDGTEYFEPHWKEDFNLDLLLSNNYICHFTVMKGELMQGLGFRPEYEGAQDYDLILRAVGQLRGQEQRIAHIPEVCYHWRCHTGSTAANPRSKSYAYEAGRRAVQDFVREAGWKARVEDTAHLGFYRLKFEGVFFESRQDVGAVGGPLVHRRRIVGGRLTEEGDVVYAGLPVGYSGYLHRAVLAQDAAAVDIRNIRVRKSCREIFRKVTGISYETIPGTDVFDISRLPEGSDIKSLSLELGRALRDAGYRILYLPDCSRKC